MRQQSLDLGQASIEPAESVAAGSHVTIVLTYTAGHPIDDTGYLRVCFRHVGDFGTPQFSDPRAPNYCRVTTDGDCRVTPRWDSKGNTRPWTRALYIQVTRGFLAEGQTITVTFGDRSGGSPGWRMQTFCETTFEFKCHVDPIATYEFKELAESPTLAIVAGPPARSLCLAPSQVAAGEPFTYHLKTEDRWGNPVGASAAMRHPGFPTAGTVQTLQLTDPLTGLTVESNPVEVVAEHPALRPYWADFHGQSEETIGTNTIDDYYAFARSRGLVDIAAHQGNDFQVTDEFWSTVIRVADSHYEPGRFVTFAGYEWSGNTPLGGDRNVYFAGSGGRISHSSTDLLPGKSTCYDISPSATDLFADLRRQPEAKPFVFAHVGGRFADVSMHDPEIEVAMEIHSAWGTFEWLLEEALERGYRVGVVANSDGHKCRPGASYPGAGEFGSLGGLTCVLAPRLDREGVYEALKARHCYATTGHRPLLVVTAGTPSCRKVIMGDVLAGFEGNPELEVWYHGTAGVERLEVRGGGRLVASRGPADIASEAGLEGNQGRLKVIWSGAEVRGRARVARWDGSLTVTGNEVTGVTPINFWHADAPVRQVGPGRLEWRSSTTGGLAGVMVELARPGGGGEITVETPQGVTTCALAAVQAGPIVTELGGLRKRLELSWLPPAGQLPREVRMRLPLPRLAAAGDRPVPVYVRVLQEDGHMAWSSPIYVLGG